MTDFLSNALAALAFAAAVCLASFAYRMFLLAYHDWRYWQRDEKRRTEDHRLHLEEKAAQELRCSACMSHAKAMCYDEMMRVKEATP